MTIREYIDQHGFDGLTSDQNKELIELFDDWYYNTDYDQLLDYSGIGNEDINKLTKDHGLNN